MNRIYTVIALMFITLNIFAQSPEKISYQAVIRNANDNLINNQSIGMQISILKGSVTGTAVYVEKQNPTTNANGLVSIEIGSGTTTDDFSAIDWASDTYFIKTETDPTGGTNYTITGTSQLLSVPYALHAKTAETVTGEINEIDPIYGESIASDIKETDIANWNNKLDNETDPVFSVWDKSVGISIIESQISDLNHFTTDDETDPVYGSSIASGITAADTAKWNSQIDEQTINYFPQSSSKSTTVLVSFSGNSNTSFSQASPVALQFEQATPIYPDQIRYINSNKVDVKLNIPWDAATGTYDIIINPNNQEPTILEKAFLIDWF